MAHAVVKDGPYFSGTGSLSFSDLRNQWLGVNSGPVSASTFFRNLNRNVTNPIVGDSTENADIASDPFNAQSFESNLTGGVAFSGTGRDWKISQMRDSIKSYTINQTNSGDYDKNVDGDNLAWNSNLDKTIPKYYNIQGNIHAVTELQPPATEPDEALKFVSDNITNLNIKVSGAVLGSGGKGGTLNWWRPASESTPNSQWSAFMGEYAVYVKPKYDPLVGKHIYNGTVTIPTTGNYSIDWQVDNIGNLTFRGQTSTHNSFTVTKNETYNNVPAGEHPISFTVDNVVTALNDWDNNPGGIAIRMTDASNNIVWSTKQIVTGADADNPGTGEPGGHAIALNSDDGKGIVVSITNNGQIYGGGGGGGRGGKGSKGPDGVYYKPRDASTGGGVGNFDSGLGEWYSYKEGESCQCEWYSNCGNSSNQKWHWSVNEGLSGAIPTDGGSGYAVGDMVTINQPYGAIPATAEVTKLGGAPGASFDENGNLVTSDGQGSRLIRISIGWDDEKGGGDFGVAWESYTIPELGLSFSVRNAGNNVMEWGARTALVTIEPNRTYAATLIRGSGTTTATWRHNNNQRFCIPDQGGTDANAQIWMSTPNNVFPSSNTEITDILNRDRPLSNFPPSYYASLYSNVDNNGSVGLYPDEIDAAGNPTGNKLKIRGMVNPDVVSRNTTSDISPWNNTGLADQLGGGTVTELDVKTGGTRYTIDLNWNQNAPNPQTTSGGSGTGLVVKIFTAKGWLRDAGGTKHETRMGYGNTVLGLGSGTYMSNRPGGGCNRHWTGLYWKNTCIGWSYCIVEDPAMGVGAEGGDGGYGGQGRGSNGEGNALMPRTDGANGTAGAPILEPYTTTVGGTGGNGGNGGDWGFAGGNGQDGQCNIECENPEDGYDGGAAGRAIIGSNYTVNDTNFNSARVKGAYQPSS